MMDPETIDIKSVLADLKTQLDEKFRLTSEQMVGIVYVAHN